jgi:two-component system nitrogen regulation response regulator NtrX
VRELRNAVERLLILAAGREVTAGDVERLLPQHDEVAIPMESNRAPTFESFRQDAERAFLLSKLREHNWNIAETARSIAVPRSNLYKKMMKYGLTRDSS